MFGLKEDENVRSMLFERTYQVLAFQAPHL